MLENKNNKNIDENYILAYVARKKASELAKELFRINYPPDIIFIDYNDINHILNASPRRLAKEHSRGIKMPRDDFKKLKLYWACVQLYIPYGITTWKKHLDK